MMTINKYIFVFQNENFHDYCYWHTKYPEKGVFLTDDRNNIVIFLSLYKFTFVYYDFLNRSD